VVLPRIVLYRFADTLRPDLTTGVDECQCFSRSCYVHLLSLKTNEYFKSALTALFRSVLNELFTADESCIC